MTTRNGVNSDQAKAIVEGARAATPFLSLEGEAYVSVPSENIDARQIYPLHSAEFRDWLSHAYYNEFEDVPAASSFRAALQTLEARARHGEMAPQKVDYRIGFEGDPYAPSRIFMDLAGHRGQLVEITSRGWAIADNFQHAFRRSNAMLALPVPAAASGARPLEEIRELLGLGAGANWSKILCWMMSAMRPSGPYPILAITGPGGSGKSLLARALRSLIDPCAVPLRRFSARDRNIAQCAVSNWLVAFDMVHSIGPAASEALAAIASGDALEISRPGRREPLHQQIARPILLAASAEVAVQSWTPPRELASRTMTVKLAPVSKRRTEAAIWREMEAIRPAAFAVLCSAVSQAMRDVREVDLAVATSFPDSAVWAAAAASAVGLSQQQVVEAFADRSAKEAALPL